MRTSKIKNSCLKVAAYLGFTLVELMVTIAVLAVIVSIAAPTISRQLADQRVKSTASTLLNVLREVRAESSINKMPVTVSYINGMRPKNIINVEAPYSGLNVFSLQTSTQDWTSFFIKSASAMDLPPLGSDSNGNSVDNGGGNSGNNGSGNSGNNGGGNSSNNGGGNSGNNGGGNSGNNGGGNSGNNGG
ncbi:pilus assembly FimT family protein, partial [Psychrobacter sp. bablab_jr014]